MSKSFVLCGDETFNGHKVVLSGEFVFDTFNARDEPIRFLIL